ncbi:uncharacterized protein EDB93DRAFT_1118967, partial [Suillus bovinus]|uniref:uncharacterized protein n=1 Tax=Suillus bovinus TaxID=48563 RepID=UPI001B87D44C
PKSIAPPHVSLHLPPDFSSFEDVYLESDAANNATDSKDDHTRTALSDVLPPDPATDKIRRLNRLRLKVKRPPFAKNRSSVQYSPKRRSAQRSQSDVIEVELRARPADSRESTPSSSSASCNYEPGQSVIVKDVPSDAKAATGWRKLPPRLPIPKWDVDD